jgi:predicted HD superfamily hydrolase involved in NAD metabolism
MRLEEQMMKYARMKLSAKRFAHVERVVAAVDDIARANSLPVEDCRIAGWLHDCAKEEPRSAVLHLVGEGKLDLDEETMGQPKLWHGYHAAQIGHDLFGITSGEILDAARYHPTGSPGLSPLGLALFVADYTEPGRALDGTALIREQANTDLPGAAMRVSREKIRYVLSKGRQPHSRSVAFLQWLEAAQLTAGAKA